MMSERQQIKKRAVNLFVDADLLDAARRLRINLSETLERRLRTIVRAEQEKQLAGRESERDRVDTMRVSSAMACLPMKPGYR